MIISVADSFESLELPGHGPEMNNSLLKCWSLAINTLFNYLASPTLLCNHCISPTHYVDAIDNNCGNTRCYEAKPPSFKYLHHNRKTEIQIEQSNTLI